MKRFEIDVGVLYGILFYFWRLWGKIVASSAGMPGVVIATMTGFIGAAMTSGLAMERCRRQPPCKVCDQREQTLATVQVAAGGRGLPSLGTADGK